jgi:hypothetical protein
MMDAAVVVVLIIGSVVLCGGGLFAGLGIYAHRQIWQATLDANGAQAALSDLRSARFRSQIQDEVEEAFFHASAR